MNVCGGGVCDVDGCGYVWMCVGCFIVYLYELR